MLHIIFFVELGKYVWFDMQIHQMDVEQKIIDHEWIALHTDVYLNVKSRIAISVLILAFIVTI